MMAALATGACATVLVLIENNSVPSDVRVWPECQALRQAGFDVHVVCPQGLFKDPELFELRDGVSIHRFPLAFASGRPASYLREYATAFWQILKLVRRLGRQRRFDVVHAGNPPDLLLLAAWPLKRKGARFIFDHHDVVPELFLARFGRSHRLLYWFAHGLERLSFRLADVVISTNESYRTIALTRGGKRPEDVVVVRNGPDLARFHRAEADPSLKRGKQHLIAYVGLMAPHDGVDHAIRALAVLRDRRQDWHAVFVGLGDSMPVLQRLTAHLELQDLVDFPGYLPTDDVVRVLSTADVCLAPEPKTPANDISTMIKVAEYMAMGCPVVAYDLIETRFTAGAAALYARPNDEASYAACVDELLSDPGRRAEMGAIGRSRVEHGLAWEHSVVNLLAAYRRALGGLLPPEAPQVAS